MPAADGPTISIRPPTPADRAAWEALFRAYLAFYDRDEPPHIYDRAWNEFLRDERMHALLACRGEDVVGITHFLYHANTSAADVCYLQDLYTRAEERRGGVGRALIEAVKRRASARGCSRLYWMTQASNETARRLYDQVAEFTGFIRYQVPLPGTPTST